MSNELLRGCPTCGTRVADTDMGLRDYRWVADALPGRVAPMDLDCVLEKNGNVLIMEFKPKGMALPLGQRLTLKAFVKKPNTRVWVVWEDPSHKHAEVGEMDVYGNVNFIERVTIAKLRSKVSTWFTMASQSDR